MGQKKNDLIVVASSAGNFLERFSFKQKSDETKSKRGTEKKRSKRNESESERNGRKEGRKSNGKDEQNNKKMNLL